MIRARAAVAAALSLLGLFVISVSSREPRAEPTAPVAGFVPAAFPARDGERLLYEVHLLGMKAGTIELRVEGGDPVRVVMNVRSTSALLERLYPVRELSCSRIDRAGTFSLRYEASKRAGKMVYRELRVFDRAAGVARLEREEEGKEPSSWTVPIDGPVQDSTSWLYYLRARVAAGAREVSWNAVRKERVEGICLQPSGEEEVVLSALGPMRAVRVQPPESAPGLFGEKSACGCLWLDPRTGVLLACEVKAPAVNLYLELVSAEGVEIGE